MSDRFVGELIATSFNRLGGRVAAYIDKRQGKLKGAAAGCCFIPNFQRFQILATSAAWKFFLVLYHRRGEKNPAAAANWRGFAVPHVFEAKRSGTAKAWENYALDKLRLIGLFVAR